MFLSAFNKSYEEYGEEKAFKIAWTVVKKKFKQVEGKWKTKTTKNLKPYAYLAKSSISEAKGYFVEAIFADIKEDLDGDEVSQDSLCEDLKGAYGDLEHVNLALNGLIDVPESDLEFLKEFDTNPLFEVVNSFYTQDKLIGKIKFNNNHKQFPLVWEQVQKGEFGISLEYDQDFNIRGITGTLVQPRNPRSKMITAYETR